MSEIDSEVLLTLVTDAENLKDYRENGTVYSEKCAEVLGRIKTVVDSMIIEELTDDQIVILNSINKIISEEEQFSRAAFKIRSFDAWKDFLND